jgi:hypothetical protein
MVLGATSRSWPILIPLCWTWASLTLVSARASAAESAGYRFQLVRAEGAASCASAEAIQSDVSARLGRNPFASSSDRAIEVVLERTEAKWRAKLYLRLDGSDADAARLIESEAPDCRELGKSVALAVALAITPELPPPPKPLPPPPLPPSCVRVPPLPAPVRSSAQGEASLRALLSPNLLPTNALGVAVAITVRAGRLLGASFGGLFFPQRELRAARAQLGFGLSAAFASGCIWAKPSDPQVWSCIGGQVGALHSVVFSPQPERPGDHWWVAASSELGLRQHVFDRAFIEAGVLALFPLVRHRFEIDSSRAPVYQQGPAVAEGFVGLGLRLD